MKTLDQPTPRTNAEIKSEPYTRFEQLFVDRSVPAQFARTLERELAAATAECLEQARLLGMSGEREADLLGKLGRLESELAAIKHGHGELGKYEQLRLKNAELQRDKARLDWLAVSDTWFDYPATESFNPETFRDAIDAAMKGKP